MTAVRGDDGSLRQAAGSPAGIGGQYAKQPTPAAAATLDPQRPARDERLDAALHAIGLNTADLPGIEQAWPQRFDDIDFQPTKSLAMVAIAMLNDDSIDGASLLSDDGKTVRLSVMRDEGGYDDPHEMTYETVVISDDTFAAEARAAAADAERALRAQAARELLAGIELGETPVWHLLAEQERLNELQAARRRAESRVENSIVARRREVEARVREAIDGVVRGGDPDESDLELMVELRDEGDFTRRAGAPRLILKNIVQVVAEDRRRESEARAVIAAGEEAKELTDGPLKQFLLGERPKSSYLTTEGKGRWKRDVRKEYTPMSELQHALKVADTTIASVGERRSQLLERLGHIALAQEAAAAAAAARAAEAREARRAHLSLGLPQHLSIDDTTFGGTP